MSSSSLIVVERTSVGSVFVSNGVKRPITSGVEVAQTFLSFWKLRRLTENPKGIQSRSPGLRAARATLGQCRQSIQPQRGLRPCDCKKRHNRVAVVVIG